MSRLIARLWEGRKSLDDRWHDWLAGWRDLARHDGIETYRTLGRSQRLRLDLRVIARALAAPGFWVGVLAVVAGLIGAEILVLRHDLRGWRRDALRCLPLVLAAPWVAAGRRRLIEQWLAASAKAITDHPPRPSHSGPRAPDGATERRPWTTIRPRTASRHPQAGELPARWISSWRSRVSACWRWWRCRDSAA